MLLLFLMSTTAAFAGVSDATIVSDAAVAIYDATAASADIYDPTAAFSDGATVVSDAVSNATVVSDETNVSKVTGAAVFV